MKAKLPRGKGIWSAFWMLAPHRLGWPKDGEIDIMEHVGYQPNLVHATIHSDKYNHVKNTQIGTNTQVNDPFNTFHVYTIDWTPSYIKAYVDGRNYFSYQKTDSSFGAWPFDGEFELLLNVAVGGKIKGGYLMKTIL